MSRGTTGAFRAWPGLPAGALPTEVQAGIPDLRCAASGMIRLSSKTQRALRKERRRRVVAERARTGMKPIKAKAAARSGDAPIRRRDREKTKGEILQIARRAHHHGFSPAIDHQRERSFFRNFARRRTSFLWPHHAQRRAMKRPVDHSAASTPSLAMRRLRRARSS